MVCGRDRKDEMSEGVDWRMKVSICIPVYQMDDWQFFLNRNLVSILNQNFKDYEIVVSDDSKDDMIKDWLKDYPVKYFKNEGQKGNASNRNNAFNCGTGDLLKMLDEDDYFASGNSLADIVKCFTSSFNWLITGCIHNANGQIFNKHIPYYSSSENTIGSPSVLTIRKEVMERFNNSFVWILDLDLYRRLFKKYGLPKILPYVNVVIGIHKGQATNLIDDNKKNYEQQLIPFL